MTHQPNEIKTLREQWAEDPQQFVATIKPLTKEEVEEMRGVSGHRIYPMLSRCLYEIERQREEIERLNLILKTTHDAHEKALDCVEQKDAENAYLESRLAAAEKVIEEAEEMAKFIEVIPRRPIADMADSLEEQLSDVRSAFSLCSGTARAFLAKVTKYKERK